MKNLNRNRYLTSDQRERYMNMANASFNLMVLLSKLGIATRANGVMPDGSVNGKLIEEVDNLVFKCLLS